VEKSLNAETEINQQQLFKYAEDVSALYQNLKKENKRLEDANSKLVNNYYQMVLMGFDLISMNNPFLGGHCKRVAHYADLLASALSLGREQRLSIKMAALLHDMGLIGISKELLIPILSGKEGSVEKMMIYYQHPNVNVRPLTSTDRFRDIARIIVAHHEHMDGSGFPKGLMGSEIPVESRVITIVDAYDNNRLTRPGRLSPGKNFEHLQSGPGDAFDPGILKAFKKLMLQQDPYFKSVPIPLEELTPGMTLAREIIAENGVKILGADTALRSDHIRVVKRYSYRMRLSYPILVYASGA